MQEKPNCYFCKNRREVPGSVHSFCADWTANVKGHPHGIKNGWFFHPFNFDPVWLEACDSFIKTKGN
jgi:hypothetical protein